MTEECRGGRKKPVDIHFFQLKECWNSSCAGQGIAQTGCCSILCFLGLSALLFSVQWKEDHKLSVWLLPHDVLAAGQLEIHRKMSCSCE